MPKGKSLDSNGKVNAKLGKFVPTSSVPPKPAPKRKAKPKGPPRINGLVR